MCFPSFYIFTKIQSVDEGENFHKKKEKFQNEKHKKRSARELMNELRERWWW